MMDHNGKEMKVGMKVKVLVDDGIVGDGAIGTVLDIGDKKVRVEGEEWMGRFEPAEIEVLPDTE